MPIEARSSDPAGEGRVRATRTRQGEARGDAARGSFERPRFEVIPLDCEITAYAPDGDLPLF